MKQSWFNNWFYHRIFLHSNSQCLLGQILKVHLHEYSVIITTWLHKHSKTNASDHSHLPTRPSLWSMNYKPVKLCDCILRGCVTVAAIKKIHCMFHLIQAHVFDGWRFYCRSGNFVALWNQLKIEAPCGCFNTCAKHHRAERPVLSSLSLGFLSLAFFFFFLSDFAFLALVLVPD